MEYVNNSINNSYDNYLINGDMAIYQRQGATGSIAIAASANVCTIDRWFVKNISTANALAVTQVAVSGIERVVTGADALFWLNIAGTTPNVSVCQCVENSRRFCGKYITLSFWVKGTVGTSIVPNMYIHFGTGGSTSESIVPVSVFNAVILTTGTPQKVTAVFAVPMYTSSIFGPDNTSFLQAGFSCSTTGNSIAVTKAMLNESALAMPFKLCGRNAMEERRLCERYYEKSYPDNISLGTATATGAIVNATYQLTGNNYFNVLFRSIKRVPVGVSVYAPSIASASGVVDYVTGSAISQASAANNVSSITAPRLYAYSNYGGSGTVQWLNYHYMTEAEFTPI